MEYSPTIYHRRSIRLRGYDYAQSGACFLTLCTQNCECMFGHVVDGETVLNDAGRMVVGEWVKSGDIHAEIELDEFVVMPNHLHAIVIIFWGDRPVAPTPNAPAPRPQSIGSPIAGFKSAAARHISDMRHTPETRLWQRNDYEHIIRNDDALIRIRAYIAKNPLQWHLDRANPSRGNSRIGPRKMSEPWQT